MNKKIPERRPGTKRMTSLGLSREGTVKGDWLVRGN